MGTMATGLHNSLGVFTQVQMLLEKGHAKQIISVSSHRSVVSLATRDLFQQKRRAAFSLGSSRLHLSSYNMAAHATFACATESVASNSIFPEQIEKKDENNAVFPDGLESLIMEICDESDVAELKIKVGNFELHMWRNIDKSKGQSSVSSSIATPSVQSKSVVNSVPTVPPPPPSSTLPKSPPPAGTSTSNPFATELSSSRTSKFGLLEASADGGLLFVTSPKVGLFRRGRIVKGKSGWPLCEEGQSIKEGQAVCYLDQLGTQQPVISGVSGEIVKILWNDGEPVGYGDPLIAVLPSFRGIE
eukprot:Gb_03536 [translate_table: standard]